MTEHLLKTIERKDLTYKNNLENLDLFNRLHEIFMEGYKVAEQGILADASLRFSPRYEKRICFELLFNTFGENQ